MTTRLDTPRLRLRDLTPDDAAFMLELLNDPAFLRYIGDKRVRTIDGARDYILSEPVASYARHGYGLHLVELKGEAPEPVGICGLLKRDWLDAPDLGFAFLARHTTRGYGGEAAAVVLAAARDTWNLSRVYAITSPDNMPSIRLLTRLGFTFDREAQATEGDTVKVFLLPLKDRGSG